MIYEKGYRYAVYKDPGIQRGVGISRRIEYGGLERNRLEEVASYSESVSDLSQQESKTRNEPIVEVGCTR